jgi:hypothetical protein
MGIIVEIEKPIEVENALKYLRDFSYMIGGTGVEYLTDEDREEFREHLDVLEEALTSY